MTGVQTCALPIWSLAWGLAFSVAFHALLFSPQLAEWAWRKDSPDAGAKDPDKAPDAAKDRPQPKQTTPDPAHGPKEQPPKSEEHSPEAKAAQPPPPAPDPQLEALASYCQVLLASNRFLVVE